MRNYLNLKLVYNQIKSKIPTTTKITKVMKTTKISKNLLIAIIPTKPIKQTET